ncbi:MAG: hypothetical protein IJV98_03065 [Clostridia bacterium]|nr:hypothetical protein [Clostridia bacterium]
MKKILATLLASSMILSFAACGGNNDTGSTTTTEEPAVTTTVGGGEEVVTGNVIAPSVEAGTVGETMWNAFLAEMTANAEIGGEELANKLVSNEIIQFFGGAMPMEKDAEWLQGFNETIKGYETCTYFGPMMGSIAFAGYIFELADGADVNAFIQTLSTNANPRWQICVTADQTVIGAHGNTVFFLMCPATFEMEMPGEGGDEFVGGDVIFPAVEVNTVGDTLWNAFYDAKDANPAITGEELANVIVTNEIIQFFGGAMPMEKDAEWLQGFHGETNPITGYETCTYFGPMMGSIAFAGYIFELAEDADVQAFVDLLAENANPRWQICVTADQTVIGAYGNTVFFLMCPATFEMDMPMGGMEL